LNWRFSQEAALWRSQATRWTGGPTKGFAGSHRFGGIAQYTRDFQSGGDFATAKASNFKKIRSISISGQQQTFLQGSLKNNEIPQISISLITRFGTRRPVVQIHSPRPLFSVANPAPPVFHPCCTVGTHSDSPDNSWLAIRAEAIFSRKPTSYIDRISTRKFRADTWRKKRE